MDKNWTWITFTSFWYVANCDSNACIGVTLGLVIVHVYYFLCILFYLQPTASSKHIGIFHDKNPLMWIFYECFSLFFKIQPGLPKMLLFFFVWERLQLSNIEHLYINNTRGEDPLHVFPYFLVESPYLLLFSGSFVTDAWFNGILNALYYLTGYVTGMHPIMPFNT